MAYGPKKGLEYSWFPFGPGHWNPRLPRIKDARFRNKHIGTVIYNIRGSGSVCLFLASLIPALQAVGNRVALEHSRFALLQTPDSQTEAKRRFKGLQKEVIEYVTRRYYKYAEFSFRSHIRYHFLREQKPWKGRSPGNRFYLRQLTIQKQTRLP